MQIDDLSLSNDNDLIIIQPEATVSEAANVLNAHKVGALPVCNPDGELVGIISERDIVRGLSEIGFDLPELSVSDLMTDNVITCGPNDDVNEIMGVMDDNHIRHIPVLKDNRLNSIISSRDIISAVLEETKTQCKTMSLAYEMVR